MEQIARMIYERSSAPQELEPYLQGVLTALGVPPLGEGDLDVATTRFKQGLPFLFQQQVAEMAEAFQSGDMYTLDSFIAAANARGARERRSHQPLTRATLTALFAPYTGKSQYDMKQALPAFVLALGKERARRSPSATFDPLWGDGLLDPLQTALLLYSISYAGARPVPYANLGTELPRRTVGVLRLSPLRHPLEAPIRGAENPIVDWIIEQLADEVTGEVQDQIEIPLDKKEAAQVSLCASLILYGHKTEVKTEPDLLYHNDGEKPSVTRVGVTVRFVDDYYSKTNSLDRWLIESLSNCEMPVQGLARGVELSWSVSDGLLKHGNYDHIMYHTDDNGSAFASWRTVPETTPKELRSFATQRDAVGSAIVRVSGLVPGWGNLEKVVNLLTDTGAVGQSRLTVIYYERPQYSVDQMVGLPGVHLTGTICALDQPFTLDAKGVNAAGGTYVGSFKFTPADTRGGNWTHTATTSCLPELGCATVTGSGTYQVESQKGGGARIFVSQAAMATGFGTATLQMAFDFDLKPSTGLCSSK
jgi:hypothetical protein